MDDFETHPKGTAARIEELETEVERLREALENYAAGYPLPGIAEKALAALEVNDE